MNITKTGRNHYQIDFTEDAAVRKQTAALFYSANFNINHSENTKNTKSGAATLNRLRLFFVATCHRVTLYLARSPPALLLHLFNTIQDRRIT